MTKKKISDEEIARRAEAEKRASDLVPLSMRDQDSRNIDWPAQTAKGAPKEAFLNAVKILEMSGLGFSHDIFRTRDIVNGITVAGVAGDHLTDALCRRLRFVAGQKYGLDPGKTHMEQALHFMCEANTFNSAIDMINGCVDRYDYGKVLLPNWVSTYLGVEKSELVDAQGAIFLTAMVTRIFEPGAKFDHVPVLEGVEGVRKSSALKVIANGTHDGMDYFSDSPVLGLDERKQQELTKGVIVYELAELAGMRKADQFAVKNFITKQHERARAAYGHFDMIQPRSPVFAGSFNTTPGGELIEYLNPGDQRRWWPWRVGVIDIDGLKRDRDQLLAEAYFAMKDGAALYLPPELEAQAKGIAATRAKVDPLVDILTPLYSNVLHACDTDGLVIVKPSDHGDRLYQPEAGSAYAVVGASEVWVSAEHVVSQVPPSRKHDGTAIASAMDLNGWQKVKDYRSGTQVRGYAHKIDPLS
jgi:hypothetical protein